LFIDAESEYTDLIMKSLISLMLVGGAFFLGKALVQPEACGAVCGAHIGQLEAGDFHRLSEQREVVVLDVRTPEEFDEGHIPQAHNVDMYNQTQVDQFLRTADKDKPYLVYCRTDNRSQHMRDLMAARGFTHVVNLTGGIQAWATAGYDISEN
jgi:rhodanese-related sulfurtransferase